MQKYQDVVLRADGRPAVGATVTVTTLAGAPASLYSSNSLAAGISGNSVVTDATGEYSFYASNGHYNLAISYPAYTGETKVDVLLFDPADNATSFTAPTTTKGDLFGFSTINARIPVGADMQVLTADSTQPLGVKWATAATSVFNVLNYGAVGDGVTDDYSAVSSALTALYANKGGTLLFPFKPAGYKLGTSVVIDPSTYNGGGGITILLSGNHFTQSHNGWMFDLRNNYFGTNNASDTAGFKRTIFDGQGAFMNGTGTASGAVRMSDNVRSVIKNITASGYTLGVAVRLQVSNVSLYWTEMNVVEDVHSIATQCLLHLMSGGNLDGLNANGDRFSNSGSFRSCRFENLTHQGDVNNAIGFNIEGSGSDSVWLSCGGFVNQGTTGGVLFNFNGSMPGVFIGPWSDVAGTPTPQTNVTFGANANTGNVWAWPVFVEVGNLLLPHNWRSRIIVIGPVHNGGTNLSGNSPREVLTADRTYYVNASTGSDSNAGMNASDATGKGYGPFATIAKALSVIQSSIDCAGFNLTIQLADGTYTTPVSINFLPVGLSGATFTLSGNTGTPGNVILSTTSADALTVSGNCPLMVQGIELRTTTSGTGLVVSQRAQVTLSTGMRFGACATRHIAVTNQGQMVVGASYTISGNAPDHWQVNSQGQIIAFTGTITATGRTFSGVFARCSESGYIGVGVTFVNTSTTGTRYFVDSLSLIQTFGSGATYFPGSVSGSVANSGLYL